MNRDPFYRDIIDRLKGPLDAELFERCAVALLREVWAGLVPIRGGDDSGADGIIADTEGEQIVLVATTAKDVIGNLRRNLSTYVGKGRSARKVIVATSQELSGRRRENLKKQAADLGFHLIQSHAQGDLADRLYHRPEWCRELLNLTGEPPALSLLPVTRRPLATDVLIGRDDDLGWLKASEGDLLVVGQPGSGKTFLLRTLAKEGEGLFVVRDDVGQIASAIRSQSPSCLIVDDAHIRVDIIEQLRHLREEVGAKFRIIADCWPGASEKVATALNVTPSGIRELGLLTREEIVKVINAAGIAGPNALMHELVGQAIGRPGLAVTLSHICLAGNVRDVALGDALSRDIRTSFERLVGREAAEILAGFSIGGDAGMTIEVVARNCGLAILQVKKLATDLAAGGVLTEMDSERLAVLPATLRYALVRDTFFAGATSLPVNGLIAHAPYPQEVVLTLIGARARGGQVPNDLLVPLLEQSRSGEAWKGYAYLGHAESAWILREHPEKLMQVAKGALREAPDLVIPMLLARAVGDERQLHSSVDHPLRIIDDWAKSAYPGSGEVVDRRQILLDCSLDWVKKGRDLRVGLEACRSSVSPSFQDSEVDPGRGMNVSLRFGLISSIEMRAVQSFWPRIHDVIRSKHVEDWRPVKDIFSDWAYPGRHRATATEEVKKQMKSFARMVLGDLVEMAHDHQGVLHWAKHRARSLRFQIDIALDPEFEMLYPVTERAGWRKQDSEYAQRVEGLAGQWALKKPEEIIPKLMRFKNQSGQCASVWPQWDVSLCKKVASKTQDPISWARQLLASEASGDFVIPFVQQAMEMKQRGWKTVVYECIETQRMKPWIVPLVLATDGAAKELFDKAMENAAGLEGPIGSLCSWGKLSEERVQALFKHKDPKIAVAAAIGEWEAEPKKTVRESLRQDWRATVIQRANDEFELQAMFSADASLAFDWLRERLKRAPDDFWGFREREKASAAIAVLDRMQRKDLLEDMSSCRALGEVINELVGGDLELYGFLLESERLRPTHLWPLEWCDDPVWLEKVLMALDKGYPAEEIAGAALGRGMSWGGKESAVWAEWVDRFASLSSHHDSRVREVGRLGHEHAKANEDRAMKRERSADIYGR